MFGAVEFWVQGADGYIVREEGHVAAHNFFWLNRHKNMTFDTLLILLMCIFCDCCAYLSSLPWRF